MAINKRRHSRLDSVINGTFICRQDNACGDIVMTNFSQGGFQAALSRPIVPGRIINFQMRYDQHAMPVFATGKVVWVREKNQNLTYGFDAGIHLLEPDAVVQQKASEYDFDNWHIKQVAEFAKQKGYLVKHYPERSLRLSCFLPSLLLVYFVLGAMVSLFYINIALVYAASIMAYFLSIFATTIFWLLTEKSNKTVFEKISLIIPVSAARISSQISYGVFFLRGLFSKEV